MSMTPKERLLAVLNGEEPDKIPVCTYDIMLTQLPGGWFRRLKGRGLALIRLAEFSTPVWRTLAEDQFPNIPDVKYTQTRYIEKGILKYRHTYDTPAGSITGVMMANPIPNAVAVETPEEYLIKEPSDWRVINYIMRGILDRIAPNYKGIERIEDELGDDGIVIIVASSTAWQWAWIELAGPERAVIDFHEQPEELEEYIDLCQRLHTKKAELAAGSPAKFVDIAENMSDMILPRYYQQYCLPIYEIYSKQLKGTGKVLGVHMDGRLGHLKKEIAETPINVIESFSLPPTGDVSLADVRSIWPDKMVFMNTAPHLAWAEPGDITKFYEGLVEEWGSKKGLLLELSEALPLANVEAHLSAAMDAFGY